MSNRGIGTLAPQGSPQGSVHLLLWMPSVLLPGHVMVGTTQPCISCGSLMRAGRHVDAILNLVPSCRAYLYLQRYKRTLNDTDRLFLAKVWSPRFREAMRDMRDVPAGRWIRVGTT